jgi:hypothetical protein
MEIDHGGFPALIVGGMQHLDLDAFAWSSLRSRRKVNGKPGAAENGPIPAPPIS